jgi:hypothetical protein
MAASFQIISPAEGATYYIDPTLRREFQALPLRVSDDSRNLRWTIDGRTMASTEWPIAPGRHETSVAAPGGRRDDIVIYVK